MLHLLALTGQTTDQSAPVGGFVLIAAAIAAVVLFVAGAVVGLRTYRADGDEVEPDAEESDTLTV